MPPLNTQELPLISAQFTNVGSGGPWDKSKLNHSDCGLNKHIRGLRLMRDNLAGQFLSGAISTLMASQSDSTDTAALNPTPSFTN